MKFFELPKSDCGHFMGGLLGDEAIQEMIDDGAPPQGVVIFYKDIATMKAAMEALSGAHWPDSQ